MCVCVSVCVCACVIYFSTCRACTLKSLRSLRELRSARSAITNPPVSPICYSFRCRGAPPGAWSCFAVQAWGGRFRAPPACCKAFGALQRPRYVFLPLGCKTRLGFAQGLFKVLGLVPIRASEGITTRLHLRVVSSSAPFARSLRSLRSEPTHPTFYGK